MLLPVNKHFSFDNIGDRSAAHEIPAVITDGAVRAVGFFTGHFSEPDNGHVRQGSRWLFQLFPEIPASVLFAYICFCRDRHDPDRITRSSADKRSDRGRLRFRLLYNHMTDQARHRRRIL